MTVPCNDVATCLVKCKEGNAVRGLHFGKGVAPLQMRKDGSDQRKDASFRRPPQWVGSSNFYRVGTEIL